MSFDRDPGSSEEPAPVEEPSPLVAPVHSGEEPGAGTRGAPAADAPSAAPPSRRMESRNMLPPRERRRSRVERLFVRLIATGGIVGVGVVIAAIMVSSHSAGWIVGLVVSIVTVVLAAILWSSRQL